MRCSSRHLSRSRVRPAFAAGLGALALFLPAGAGHARPIADSGVVRFSYPDTTAKQVSLAGDFNGWSPMATPLDREGAAWVTRVFLDPGVYEYKFQADGIWQLDPDNPERSARGNSVVRVGPDGEVQAPRPTAGQSGGTDAATGGGTAEIGWQLRYVGLLGARRDPDLGRYDLETPEHRIDLRLDARITPELSGWFLAKVTNRAADSSSSHLALRYDRGLVEWTPGTSSLRLFDNVEVASFDDPGALVGRVGIYADDFGHAERGLAWRQRFLGAPLELLYADDAESGANLAPPLVLPPLADSCAAAGAGPGTTYTTSPSHRGADVLALLVRGGTDDLGVGLGLRLDRGRQNGRLLRFAGGVPAGDTLAASGRAFETSESSYGWALDARGRWRRAQLAAEYLRGRREAVAVRAAEAEVRALGCDPPQPEFAAPTSASDRFDLDSSQRAILRASLVRAVPAGASADPPWSARPGTGRLDGPAVEYEYEEHDFSALVAGAPFLMRRHTLRGGVDGERFGIALRLDLEQHWFRYPEAASWETQFWFRRQNFWLDEDTASLERMTLLGVRTASVARLHASRALWSAHDLRAELHATYSAPGFEHSPRFCEGILRLAVRVAPQLELRTHSRLALYRQFETEAPQVVAALGPGSHFEAGLLPSLEGAAVARSHQAFGAHFVEVVYAVTARSDVALGFGVDPFVIYAVTNEYEPVGWDAFLFANGASPASAGADPVHLGRRLEAAERALERERRLTLEVRLRF